LVISSWSFWNDILQVQLMDRDFMQIMQLVQKLIHSMPAFQTALDSRVSKKWISLKCNQSQFENKSKDTKIAFSCVMRAEERQTMLSKSIHLILFLFTMSKECREILNENKFTKNKSCNAHSKISFEYFWLCFNCNREVSSSRLEEKPKRLENRS
jgi:hypothetical protein